MDQSTRSKQGNLDFARGRVKTVSVRRTERPLLMLGAKMIAVAVAVLTVSAISKAAAAAEHKCDPVTDAGWSVVPEREVLSQTDGAPYQSGTDWLVERVTTGLPFCHYFNSIGGLQPCP